MKKPLLLTIAALTLVAPLSTQAGSDSKNFSSKIVVEERHCRFRNTEFQIDTFYTGFFGDPPGMPKGSRFQTGSGGGFGFNFIFARYFGIGYEAAWYSNKGTAEHMPLGVNGIIRVPFCRWNIAPYTLVGVGAAWNGRGTAYGNIGGGLEYRFTDNIGIFVDSRFFYGGVGYTTNLRSGLRLSF